MQVRNLVIAGGGTAGWMAAASLATFLPRHIKITLIESSHFSTVGVGEATLPGIRDFNASLGIDEVDFIKKTQATFKLAIRFEDWLRPGHSFYHPFADYGAAFGGISFYQAWLKSRSLDNTRSLQDYCLPIALCQQNRFAQPNVDSRNPLADYKYAFHFDAQLYANYLKQFAVNRNVAHLDDTIVKVELDNSSGHIKALLTCSGHRVEGDLFIDCTGFRGLLIEETLQTGYTDWSHWLPMDRAVAMQCRPARPALNPYTVSRAQVAGWQWRIPLQHRVGNGYVYSSRYTSDEEAVDLLQRSLEGDALTAPRLLKFRTGMRKRFWNKNCVALGLAGGFIEPLESTSISLIQTTLAKLLDFFPYQGFDPLEIDEANRLNRLEFERIRDFIVLHYKLNQRDDGELWRYTRAMKVPDTLDRKLDLFRRRGHLLKYEGESFGDASWLTIYNGFGVLPDRWDGRVDLMDSNQLTQNMHQIAGIVNQVSTQAPTHHDFIQQHCAAAELETL